MACQSHPARMADKKLMIKLEWDLCPELEPFEINPKDVSRALIKLVNNAIEALLPVNGPTHSAPTIRLSSQLEDDHVVITVQDNGPGIPKEDLGQIFDPFFTTKTTGTGNIGLGLAVCYDVIVGQHGGRIEVDSKPQNTSVKLYLPTCKPEVPV